MLSRATLHVEASAMGRMVGRLIFRYRNTEALPSVMKVLVGPTSDTCILVLENNQKFLVTVTEIPEPESPEDQN